MISHWDVPPIHQSEGKTEVYLSANMVLPTGIRNDHGKKPVCANPDPLMDQLGLLDGPGKPGLTLSSLGFYKGADLLLLTLICLAWAAENQ